MPNWLRLLKNSRVHWKSKPWEYGDVGTGHGTVVDPDNIFSERQAAMENMYFRKQTAEDLKRLKKELEKRREGGTKSKNQGDEVKDTETEKK